MNRHESAFLRIAEETRVIDQYSFWNRDFGTVRIPARLATDDMTALSEFIAAFIYLFYYARDWEETNSLLNGTLYEYSLPSYEDPGFVEWVISNIDGAGYVVPGFAVLTLSDDRAVVRARGLLLSTVRGDLVYSGELRVGATVGVRFPPYLRYAQRKWFLIFGEAGSCDSSIEPVLRLYFGTPEASVVGYLVGALTRGLNAADVPFQIKLVNNPTYRRRDSFILYLPSRHWSHERSTLTDIHAELATCFCDDGPYFARKIGRGWWMGPEPGRSGLSFGQHRCLLVAEALVDARRQGALHPAHRYACIAERFRVEGIELRAPYHDSRIHVPELASA